jgi:outer membrane protein OmpA-like peptidoglycan-associated protein
MLTCKGFVRILFHVALAATLCSEAYGQAGEGIGLIGGVTINVPDARFRQLGSFPSCCPEFTNGSGMGGQFGGWVGRRIADRVSIIGRLLLSWDNVSFTDDESSFVADLRDTPRVVPALFRHQLQSSHAAIVIEPLVAFTLFDRTSLMFGPRVALGLSSTFRQTETLVEPADFGSFVGTGRVWIDNSGDIPSTQVVAAWITSGLRTTFNLRSDESLTLSPELTYSYAMNNVSQGANWKPHALRLSVSLGWNGSTRPPDVLVPAIQVPAIVDAEPTKPPAPEIRLKVYGINDDGTIILDPIIERRVTKVINLHPMLGHVYFDDNSSMIPERYLKGTARAIRDTLTLTSMEALHGELAIIALRMKARPQARLRVGGMTANTATDKGAELARRRAESVVAKLIDLGIESERMELITGDRLFPATRMSDTSERVLAIEENRRVEISCTDDVVMGPISLGSIDISVFPKRLRVADSITSSSPLTVSTDIRLDDTVVSVPRTLDAQGASGDVDLTSIVTGSASRSLNVKVTATDSAGQTGQEVLSIPIRRQDTSISKTTRSGELQVERYGLVLFDFNTANIGPHHMLIINIIKSRITPTTTVAVYGMTDRAGSDDYNRLLSLRRAREVARMLGVKDVAVEGLGEDSPQFPNQLPEGRAANRTVIVELRSKAP